MKLPPPMLNQRKKTPVSAIVASVVVVLVAVLVLLDCLRAMFLITVEIRGSSMMNTLYGGERVGNTYEGGDIVYALKNFTAERGDVILVDTSESGAYIGNGGDVFASQIIIKRLIAVEGDSVKCENGVVYLKEAGGEYVALDEPYAIMDESYHFEEVTVGEGQVFCLGDNRPVSLDSQEVAAFGYALFDCDSIIGVVPEWAISIKWLSTGWENFRAALGLLFS